MLGLFGHNSFGLVDPFETGAEPVNALGRPCSTNTADLFEHFPCSGSLIV